ncbi:MAG: hypothetical protein HS126_18780 [Anaerolineales bacterium]|nr:hypothetical protein [Anaerolineales bacterium]
MNTQNRIPEIFYILGKATREIMELTDCTEQEAIYIVHIASEVIRRNLAELTDDTIKRIEDFLQNGGEL